MYNFYDPLYFFMSVVTYFPFLSLLIWTFSYSRWVWLKVYPFFFYHFKESVLSFLDPFINLFLDFSFISSLILMILPLIPTFKVKVLVAQSCRTLCDPMDYSPLGSFVQGILQARILKQKVISFSKKCEREVAQSCLTLCNHMDCSLPGFSVHGILQARAKEWVAISFSRVSSWLRDQTQVSCIGKQILYHLQPPGKPSFSSFF